MLKIDEEDKRTINMIHVLSGKTEAEIREVLDAMVTAMVISYMENDEIRLPLIGDISISHNGDEIIGDKKVANITIDLQLTDYFKRIIGEISDGTQSEIEKNITSKITGVLRSYAES